MKLALAAAAALAGGVSAADARDLATDVWVDNWFALYADGDLVLEDSVPITTERSFNSESIEFSVELPAVIAIEAKDFKENDTGLEYIGTRRQQMGDGGMIAQFRDVDTGETLAVTDANMRCLVVHHAPVDAACAREKNPVAGEGACAFRTVDIPDDWISPGFDDSDWPSATVHTAADVGPKQGYDLIDWDRSAELVWGPNLKMDNTLLCRLTVDG